MPVPQPLKLLYDNAAKENSILPAVDLERFGIYEIGPGLAEAFDSMPISTVERLVLGPVSQLNKDGWSEILQQLQRDDASYRPPCDFDCSERVYQVVWGETQSCKYRMPEDDISYAISYPRCYTWLPGTSLPRWQLNFTTTVFGRPQITCIFMQGQNCPENKITSGELLSLYALANDAIGKHQDIAVLILSIYRTEARIITAVFPRDHLHCVFKLGGENIHNFHLPEVRSTEFFDLKERHGFYRAIGALLAIAKVVEVQ